MHVKDLQLERALRTALLILLLSAMGMGKMYAYDFSAVCETGQTLYYNITDAENHYVELVCPGQANYNDCWSGFAKPTGVIVLPESVQNEWVIYMVTSIGDYAFCECSGLTGSLTIPNSVTEIGDWAFADCSGFIGSLTIPSSMIGDGAFYGCSGFTGSLTIPNSVTMINMGAFYGCSGFTGDLTIPNSVTEIENYAFAYCSGFANNLTIPNSIIAIGDYVFYDCSGINSIIIPESVFMIGYDAFVGTGWYTVQPDGILYLNNWCLGYKGDEPMGTLIFDENTRYVSNYAFFGCSGLTGSLTIPNSVTTIGNSAFEGCSGLTSIELPDSLTTIGDYAFYNCSGSTGSLTIPNSVTTIGYAAFLGCSGFTGSLTIPNSVTTIAQHAFSGCCGFSFITSLAETPLSLSNNVFNNINRFIPVYVPCGYVDAYASMSWGGFSNFIGLCGGTVTVSTVPEEGGMATGSGSFDAGQTCTVAATANEGYIFNNWTLNGANASTNVEYTFYVAGEMSLVAHFMPDANIVFADDNVKNICVVYWDTNRDGELSYAEAAVVTNLGSAFRYNSAITSFNELQYFISLTSIGSMAFRRCTNLTSIVIPNCVTTIGEDAFEGCSGLTSIELPGSVTSLGNGAFASCSGLEQILVASDNHYYDSRENCNAIIKTNTNELVSGCKNTVIPNSVTEIGKHAFSSCEGLTFIEIPNSVTHIGYAAFGDCKNLVSINIPNSVTSIDSDAFLNCTSLTSIELPDSVTSLGYFVFAGCSGLEQIIVASDNVYYDSRENCNAIIETNTNKLVTGCKNTVIPNSVTSIGIGAFSQCIGLTSIEIPNSVLSIDPNAFQGCSSLTSIDIPNSVTTIGYIAFANCYNLTSINIPNSVTTIDQQAFYNCSGLTEIMMFGTTPPSLGLYVFHNINNTNNCPIYVPYESLNDYKTATNWSDYESRIFPMAYTTIPGYGEGEGNYRFIASPLVENTDPTTVDNMITETPYDLYRFDQSEDAEWQNYKAQTESFVLEDGQGYLYANAEDVNIIFKGEFNEDETKEVELAYDANADFAGWNLVGNPFPVSAYANKSYYTMNEAGTAVEPNAVSSATAIPTCTGVMVKADDQGETVVFNTTAPETASNQGGLRIALSQVVEPIETPIYRGDGPSTGSGTLQDKAIISFNAGDKLEKFVFNKNNARISIPQGGKDLAIACAEKQGELPLNFKAVKNGTYTLSVDVENADVDYLHLMDNLTGADVDLLQTPEYVFTAKTTDYVSRFRLVFNANEMDGPSTGSGTFAFISNGNIIVTGAEAGAVLQIVDVTGRIIVCRDAARHVSTSGMTPGVYVLRLIHSNDVKTQRIVID